MNDDQDRIVKVVELPAPVERVWKALTDYQEFGQWFRVRLDQPFVAGEKSTGQMTYPGHEGTPWLAVVERMDAPKLFSFRWPSGEDDSVPAEEQPTMLVEFRLEPTAAGTRLTITESGFSSLPDPRRTELLRGNTEGWTIQAENIARHLTT